MSKEVLKEAIAHRNAMGICALLCIALSVAAPFIFKKPIPEIVPVGGGILTVCWINMICVVRTIKDLGNND